MKIMLDCSPAKIKAYSERYDYEFWQLRTPLTRNKIAGVPYGLDNGCFTEFKEKIWMKMIDEAVEYESKRGCKEKLIKFLTMPDIVGDSQRTWELFEHYMGFAQNLPRGLVLQDGCSRTPIVWRYVSAVFVGGSDSFKTSRECINAIKTAKLLKKYVHVGRVNTPSRIKDFSGLGVDSIDGSGISRFDHMLEACLAELREEDKQKQLFSEV